MIFTSVIGLAAVYGVRETLATGIPRCVQDETLGCRFLAALDLLAAERLDQSKVDVSVAEFHLLLETTRSCDVGDSAADCEFWERWGNAMFDRVDADGNGVIDTHEKLAFSADFEHELRIDSEITEAENMSGVPPGSVSRAAFVDGFKAQMLAEAFLAADFDGDFVISLAEMEAVAGEPEASTALTAAAGGQQASMSWLEQIDMKEIVPVLAALPTAHLYEVLFPVVHGNRAVLGLDSQRRRIFWFFVCIWLCSAAVLAVGKVTAETLGRDPCQFDEHSRLGSLERASRNCGKQTIG